MGELVPYLLVLAALVAGLFTFRQCSNSDHQAGNGFTTICVEGHEYLSKKRGKFISWVLSS